MTRRVCCLLLAILFLAGCSSSAGTPTATKPSELNDRTGTGPYAGFGLDPAQPRPSFTMTDTSGAPFDFAQRTAGHPTLLFFGYTTCPDVCPTTMADIAQAMNTVSAAVRNDTYVVFVSTDFKTDTPPVIAAWLNAFDKGMADRFVGLTGTQAQIDAAQAASHITLATDGGQTHSAQVLLYGADDYARVNYVQSDNEADLIGHDLPLVATK